MQTIDLSSIPCSTNPPREGVVNPLLQTTDQEGVYILQIDNSSLELFVTCPRRAMFTRVLSKTVEGREALHYGSAVHKALELYYQAFAHGGQSTEETLFACFDVIDQMYEGHYIPLNEWRTPHMAKETLSRYVKEYRHENFTVIPESVELGFSQPLGVVEFENATVGVPTDWDPTEYYKRVFGTLGRHVIQQVHVYWTGRIDLAISQDSGLWVMDHKTSSMVGPSFWKQFELSTPQIGYCWAAEKILQRPIQGTLINCLIGRKPTRTGVSIDFERQRFLYPRHRMEEWPANTLTIVTDFLEHLMRGNFPAHFKWCQNTYGACEYSDVCCSPPKIRESLLKQFPDNVWNPLT